MIASTIVAYILIALWAASIGRLKSFFWVLVMIAGGIAVSIGMEKGDPDTLFSLLIVTLVFIGLINTDAHQRRQH